MTDGNKQILPPGLISHFEALRETPPSDPQLAVEGRAQFIASAKSMKDAQSRSLFSIITGWIPTLHFPKQRTLAPAATGILIALLLALVSVGGTVYAAQNSLPHDTLYPLKTFVEDIRLDVAKNAGTKIDLLIANNDQRVTEMAALIEEGRDIPPSTIERFQKHTQSMLQTAAGLEGQRLAQALLRIRYAFLDHAQAMTNLMVASPGKSGEALMLVQSRLEEQIQLAEQGILDPASYQDVLQESGHGSPGSSPELPDGREEEGGKGPEEDGTTPVSTAHPEHPKGQITPTPYPSPTTQPTPTSVETNVPTTQPTPTNVETEKTTPIPTKPTGAGSDRGGQP